MPKLNFKAANALYIHFPFCSSKCPYCDFYSGEYTEKRVDQYWAALFMELAEFYPKLDNKLLQTIYFGGGTPSLIRPELIKVLIDKIKLEFKLPPTAEITIEANPASLSEKKLIAFKRAGINRLSLGIQSFNDHYLSLLGRKSSSRKNKEILQLLKKYFKNYSLDLIFALPGQKVSEFEADLTQLLEFSPPHISLYNLEIHEGTPFQKKFERGEFKLPSQEIDAEMYELALNRLEKENYCHYEISNFAQPGYRARHNYIYWLYQPYLALGPGAAGFDGRHRYQNKRSLDDYLDYYNPERLQFSELENKLTQKLFNDFNLKKNRIKKYQPKKDGLKRDEFKKIEIKKVKKNIRTLNFLPPKEQMAEFIFLALRTQKGLLFYQFYQKFKIEFKKIYKKEVDYLKNYDLINEGNQRIYLTARGKEVANEVFLRFLPK